MRRPVTTAAATLTAIGLGLSASYPSVAQNISGAPVDLLNRGSDVSIRSNDGGTPASYFVGADGSIQYGDPGSQLGAPSLTATGSGTNVDAFPTTPGAVTDAIVAAPLAADVFDAAPGGAESVTLETLQNAFADDALSAPVSQSPGLDTLIEEAAINAGAPAGGFYDVNSVGFNVNDDVNGGQTVSDNYGYAVDNGFAAPTVSPTYSQDYTASPVLEQTVETYQVTVTPPPFPEGQHLAPLAPATPFYAEPAFSDADFGGAVIAETVVPLPVSQAPVLNSYSSLEPAPFAPSGRDFAARGDGSYGPSTIKNTGEGPAAQKASVFVAKSTILELPAEAHEVIVSDPTLVRAVLRTARQVVLIGLRTGQTGVTVFDETGNQILSLDTNIQYDLRPLEVALSETFPGSNIQVESVLGEVIVKGQTGGAAEAESVRDLVRRYLFSAMVAAGLEINPDQVAFVDRLSTSTNGDQVLVKVRIAEMRRSIIKQFGVDFNLARDTAVAAATGGVFDPLTNFTRISNAFGVNGAALGGIAANIAGSFEDVNFGAMVQAFERHNVMRTLAEPTLTAVSGETASFLAGGQFPFPTSSDDGSLGFTFRDFGVALEFTPVVVGEGRISLTVSTEISELTSEGAITTGGLNEITIPGISVRRANTTVELPSGGTMSIAGMLLQSDSASHAGLPGLKNVPIIGQLVSSTDYQKQETELVILVTPYIVKPGQEKEFRLPTDGFAPASDFDLYLLGRLQKVYGAGDPNMASAREALKAPFGFILE